MILFDRKRLFFIIPTSLLLLASCDKFKGDQTIPAYIRVEAMTLTTAESQGTASHKITDVWAYAGNDLIGAFQLPATFPVLKQGLQDLKLYAGVKMNGIASTRVAYPFYEPFSVTASLTPDSVISFTPQVNYYNGIKFVWMENFEAGGSSFEKTAKSDTAIVVSSEQGTVFEGSYSGRINLSDSALLFEAATMNTYTLPTNGAYVFLEMNYRNNNRFTVGLIGESNNQVIQQPCMVLNHSENWNKIYINLTPVLQEMTSSSRFKIFLGALKEDDVAAPFILVDNFKVLHFE
ncbi:MAG TPA: hypothetical protein P5531_04255 [Bacteroidales bacterium]|nr:hypothetical protein [Bacteroidales bacterium]HSA42784.1 hypothetical protein [Bacteroidales bacterium]